MRPRPRPHPNSSGPIASSTNPQLSTHDRISGTHRFYQAIKYEHLYRHEIGDGLVLAREAESYLTMTIYNTIRPHEATGFTTPLARYPPGANLQAPATVSDS
jgi:hypothetical protein